MAIPKSEILTLIGAGDAIRIFYGVSVRDLGHRLAHVHALIKRESSRGLTVDSLVASNHDGKYLSRGAPRALLKSERLCPPPLTLPSLDPP